MDLDQMHFAHPWWLWGGLAIPLMWGVFFLFYRTHRPLHQLEKFIDSHLLPYLLVNNPKKESFLWKALLLWSVVWCCLTLALAGPRWNFREMETFSQDQSLVILLDLSESMNTTDIKPSRLVRAKQKIEDLLNLSKGVKIGIIAFAADPHMITPITEDKETIRHLLPSLETDLVYVQGSRLSSALEMASTMLEAEPGNNKAILVISDGGFEDASAITTAKKLAEKGIVIHVMGIGTAEGAPLINKNKKITVMSKLEKERLNEISKVGKGRYLEGHYSDHEESIILSELEKHANAQLNIGKKRQFWDERFYLMILPVLPIILFWFRRGYVFIMMVILFTPAFELKADIVQDYFMNSEELGKQALDGGDYDKAINTFQDPYRKGVACYRANNFAEAEKLFRQSSREEVSSDAAYNLGNSLAQQQKLKEAIKAYEDVLKKWPDHTKAKENLELVKKMLEQQKQENSKSENSDQQNDHNENGSENKDQNESQESNEESKNKENSENQNTEQSTDQEKKQSQKQDQKQSEDQDQKQSVDQDQKQSKANSQQIDQDSKREKEEQGKEEKGDSQNVDKNNIDRRPELQEGKEETKSAQKESKETKASKSQEDQDADQWLNRIENDPKTFLKNKFYIESKSNGTKEGIDPW